MQSKLFAICVFCLTILTGCSTIKNWVYRPDIHQGNYLDIQNIEKIHKGMTKDQVLYVLGTPMLIDYFGDDIWYYVFFTEKGHDAAQQQTLTLAFDKEGKLMQIDNKLSEMAER